MTPRSKRPGVLRPAVYTNVEPEVLLQLHALLERPDPPTLQGRGARLIYDGAPDRFTRWLPIRVRAIRAREVAALGLLESEAVGCVSRREDLRR